MKSLKSVASVAIGCLLISVSSMLACEIPIDIHPTSCPNPINVSSKGLVPAAILGTEKVSVSIIDINHPNGVQMVYPRYGVVPPEGTERIVVQAVKFAYKDVAEPYGAPVDCENEYSCTENGPDGYMDLALKFPTQGFYTGKAPNKVYHPGVADLLKGLANGETRCLEINGWTSTNSRRHNLDVVIVKGVKKAKKLSCHFKKGFKKAKRLSCHCEKGVR